MSTLAAAAAAPLLRVLVVGTGMTGALVSYHLRRRGGARVRVEVADMARGAGGRMSTTRWAPPAQGKKTKHGAGGGGSATRGDQKAAAEVRANTGAQYVSCCSPESTALLESVCRKHGVGLDRVEHPLKRSTHFLLRPNPQEYEHFLPRGGTNQVVKTFLRASAPAQLCFGTRLHRLLEREADGQICPQFDRGGGGHSRGQTGGGGGRGGGGGGLSTSFDCVVLAMPPKDILRFFNSSGGADPQSQADLHRRTNKSKRNNSAVPTGHRHLALPADVRGKLRVAQYNGRYSLAQWFPEGDAFVRAVCAAWKAYEGPHETIDMVSSQPGGALVVQSTVGLWRRVEGGGNGGRKRKNAGGGFGGGRQTAQKKLVAALEKLAGRKMPRPRHRKLLNWRTSQATTPLVSPGAEEPPVVSAAGGRLVFTGDWAVESSFEGCNIAAMAASEAALMQCAPPASRKF